MHHTTGRNRTIGSALGLVGAILLIVALAVGWYTMQLQVSAAGQSLTGTYTFNEGNSWTQSCSGSSFCPPSTTQPYSNATNHYNKTGQLYGAAQWLTVGGLVLGLLGGVLGLLGRSKQGMVMPAIALLALALILALVTPMMLLAAQPGALNSDFNNPTGTGPQSSFFGSCSGTGCGTFGPGGFGNASVTASWGPGAGWYLSIVAFVLFLVAVIFYWMARKAPPAPAPVDVPMAGAPAPMGAAPPAPVPPGGGSS